MSGFASFIASHNEGIYTGHVDGTPGQITDYTMDGTDMTAVELLLLLESPSDLIDCPEVIQPELCEVEDLPMSATVEFVEAEDESSSASLPSLGARAHEPRMQRLEWHSVPNIPSIADIQAQNEDELLKLA
jgi:hypothetical protein